MGTRTANSPVATLLELDPLERTGAPSDVERAFACQLATSVWPRQLGEEAALEVLSAYSMARFRGRPARACLRIALESEYRLCRERLDLCS
jgi:hypothetical protein